MNWLAVVCAGAVYWVLGWVWYAVLFGKIWRAGLEQTGVKLQQGGMVAKMIGTFIANMVAATIMGHLVQRIPVVDLAHGLRLGVGVGIGFSATGLTIVHLWESKPFKVWLVDSSYHVLGCILLGAILSVWH